MSKFLKLKVVDFVKGLVVAVIAAVLLALQPVLAHGLPNRAQLMTALMGGVSAGIAYLIKNLLSNSEGKMFAAEPSKDDTKA
jgi:uncharacterized membrane protein YvlD (DUF360 family)